MAPHYNPFLLAGGLWNLTASLLHVAIIFGGANWYRFFGAGEKFAQLAEKGSTIPVIVTAVIALVLFAWCAYALSGAGVIAPLPLLKPALALISAVYMLRALALLPVSLWMPGQVSTFLVVSSVICLGYGVIHVVGTCQVWAQLPS